MKSVNQKALRKNKRSLPSLIGSFFKLEWIAISNLYFLFKLYFTCMA